jgi:hypothetical protein
LTECTTGQSTIRQTECAIVPDVDDIETQLEVDVVFERLTTCHPQVPLAVGRSPEIWLDAIVVTHRETGGLTEGSRIEPLLWVLLALRQARIMQPLGEGGDAWKEGVGRSRNDDGIARSVHRNSCHLPVTEKLRFQTASNKPMARPDGQLVDIADVRAMRAIVIAKAARASQIVWIDKRTSATGVTLGNIADVFAERVRCLQKQATAAAVLQQNGRSVVVRVADRVTSPAEAGVLRKGNECLGERDCLCAENLG